MGRRTKTKKAKKRRAAPTDCFKDVVIQKCPGKSTRACAISRGRKRSCRAIRFSGAHGTYQRMRSRSANGTVLQIRKARRSRTTKIEYIPPGVVDLGLYIIPRLEMHDVVLPEGLRTLRFTFVNMPPYPSPNFRNITLPNSMDAIYIEESPVSSLDPTDWRNVPLKTLYVTNLYRSNPMQSFLQVVHRNVRPHSLSAVDYNATNPRDESQDARDEYVTDVRRGHELGTQ
ncbi:hypothetical protein AC1031_000452 [Aphanomyces cochlioides]|nr:hypothetical protein AC1031_000452 [Aphanomyces cochlioides]